MGALLIVLASFGPGGGVNCSLSEPLPWRFLPSPLPPHITEYIDATGTRQYLIDESRITPRPQHPMTTRYLMYGAF